MKKDFEEFLKTGKKTGALQVVLDTACEEVEKLIEQQQENLYRKAKFIKRELPNILENLETALGTSGKILAFGNIELNFVQLVLCQDDKKTVLATNFKDDNSEVYEVEG